METIAFTGLPGSGKSDRALVIAYENGASCIIDDGILIYHNRIAAGISAKKEPSYLGAVRRALFWDDTHAEDVRRKIIKINPAKILILGTSDKMAQRIADRLKLPEPSRFIHIEDVAKPEEIEQAREARHKEGKHVIPVPTMELRPYFKGYLVDSLRFFRNKKRDTIKQKGSEERSVVRPVFSYYGKLTFSNRVIETLVRYAVKDMKKIKIYDISSERSRSQTNGIILYIDLKIRQGTPQEIKRLIHMMRDKIQKEIEYTTGMSLETIKLNVTTVVAK